MYPVVWVNDERQTPLYAFLRNDNNAVVVPTKEQETKRTATAPVRRNSSKGSTTPPNTKDDFGVDVAVYFHERLSASHTFLSGGNYFVSSSNQAAFYRAYAAEIVHCRSSPNMYDGPYPSINELALENAHPLYFDVDFACLGVPTPSDQAAMSYVYRVIQECVRSCYVTAYSDEQWKSKGSMFVSQTLGRIKDVKSAVLKWNPSINASQQGRRKQNGVSSPPSLFHSGDFSLCDESAMDGFGTPDSMRRATKSTSSSTFHSSPLSSSSATVGMMGPPFDDDDDSDLSFADVEELFSHSLSSWSAPSTVLASRTCDPSPSSTTSSSNGGAALNTSMLMSSQLASDGIYMPLAQRTVDDNAKVHVKIGAHVVLNNLIVSPERNLEMRDYIIDKLTELSFNPALHNLLRLCMLSDSPVEFKACQYNKHYVRQFWSKVIDADVYKGISHKKMEWSDKKTRCLPCSIWKTTRRCDVCGKRRSHLNASEGKASIGELIHALDGDGNPLARYNHDPFYESHPAFRDSMTRPRSSASDFYRDASLHKLKQQYGVFIPSEFLAIQSRYDAQQYANVLRAVYDSNSQTNTSLSFPTNRVISSIPVPIKRGVVEQIQYDGRVNFVFDVVNCMSVRLAVDTVGVTEKAWSNMLTAGFQMPSDATAQPKDDAHGANKPRRVEKSRWSALSTDPVARDMMQSAIRSCRPQWARLAVVSMTLVKTRPAINHAPFDDSRTSAIEIESLQYKSVHWVVTVMGSGSQDCAIACRSHTSRSIQFVVTPGHFFQVCPSTSARQRPPNARSNECIGTYGGIWRTPEKLRKCLFRNPSLPAVQKFISEIESSPRWQLPSDCTGSHDLKSSSAAALNGPVDDSHARMLIESGYVLPVVSAETLKSMTDPKPFSSSTTAPNRIAKTGDRNLSLSLSVAPNDASTAAPSTSVQSTAVAPPRNTDQTGDASKEQDIFSAPAPKRRMFTFLEPSAQS